MADVVTSQTIQDGERKAVLKFTNASDGTGESAVKKVDVSALTKNSKGETCTTVQINKIWWQCTGMSVKIDFDATTNVLAIGLSPDSNGFHDYSNFSGIPNNAGSGVTGDLDFTTVGHTDGDTYMIILELVKGYG
jgi:hypothetical protein|tara:strand:+ start:3762 stop:4166 length:405 start_codon:yes stop_codon:yes gene_type:complete